MKPQKFTTVIGHGWTGSSIVVELLEKNVDYTRIKSEFCLFWEPGGLTDLFNGLTKNWDVLVHDYHIRRFLKTCEEIHKTGGIITKWYNRDLREQIGINLVEWSQKLINELVDFTYQNNRFLLDYRESDIVKRLRRFERSIERRLGLNPSKTRDYYFCGKDKHEVAEIIKVNIARLFEHIPNVKTNLLLDQALLFNTLTPSAGLLSNPKIIVVDRDPRDALVGMIKRNMLFGSQFSYSRKSYQEYKQWSARIRVPSNESNQNLYCTTFERFVTDHKNEVNKLSEFVSADLSVLPEHMLIKAQSNIGVWENSLRYDGCEDILQEIGDKYFA